MESRANRVGQFMGERPNATEEVVLLVEYEGADELLQDHAETLSSGGTILRTERVLERGTRVILVLTFPGLIEPIRLPGVVSSTSGAEEPSVGIDFLDFEAGGRERLEQVIRAIGGRDPGYVGRVVKILVVEDNPHVADLIRDGLRAASARIGIGVAFDFRTSEDGRAALNLIEREDFDALIVDVYLPVLDGSHLIARVRADERTRHLPVIAVSGGGEAARKLATDAGADLFVNKPMRLRQIIDSMTKLMARIDG
jgi:CheY-like chemotaxis protein